MTLSEAEEHELNGFLARVKGGVIPNVEALDGFFAALACCPDMIRPSEYLPIIQSGTTEDGTLAFEGMDEAQRFITLISRFFNDVNQILGDEDEIYIPFLREAVDEDSHAEDWAQGFMAGTKLRPEIWSGLIHDEDKNGLILPILILAHENDPDPECRPLGKPMDTAQRQGVITMAAAAVMRMYDYFREEQAPDWLTETDPSFVRRGRKIGRNEPCPCGSGKKFKRCCARAEVMH